MKILLVILVLWDLGLSVCAIGFAPQLDAFIRFPPQPEPLFTRGVGVYWLFAAYIQLLGFLNPRKFVVALQLAIIFRLSAAVIDTVEVVFLLPRPFYFFHYTLLFFVCMNVLIAILLSHFMNRLQLRRFDVSSA
ncbi:MAG: hypothetical protein LAN70_07460 [Acidobacteriia bacterium]|nr:hypothetical protein [Terriglobia bacterium]